MTLRVRAYDHATDFARVSEFLSASAVPGDHLVVWPRPRWSYMHFHPNVEQIDRTSIGVAEDDGEVRGVVHPEDAPAFCYLQLRSHDRAAADLLLDWAEKHLGGWSRTFERELLGFYIEDSRKGVQASLRNRGYAPTEHDEPHARISLTSEIPPPPLPTGYRLLSLAEENDPEKINAVLWRGFGHEGPPPGSEIPGRLRVQEAPGFRHDRNIVITGPEGDFVAYAGIWIDDRTRAAYVEPVATDPDHRRIGLGRAAVVEALRRAREDGATVAWVGSDQEFYRSMGFGVTCRNVLWLSAT